MNRRLLVIPTGLAVLVWISAATIASAVGLGTREADLLAEKGPPASRMSAGAKSILRWPDMEVTVQDGVVTKVVLRDAAADAKAAALQAAQAEKAKQATAAKDAIAAQERLRLREELLNREKGKKLWARSVLGQRAPTLQVQQWLSAPPDTQGKFVLIEFWATWCGRCRESIPHLNALHKQFGNRLVVIGISDEPETTVQRFAASQIAYSVAIDRTAVMKKALGVTGVPHAILIDPAGFVRWEGFPLLEQHELTPEIVEMVVAAYSGS